MRSKLLIASAAALLAGTVMAAGQGAEHNKGTAGGAQSSGPQISNPQRGAQAPQRGAQAQGKKEVPGQQGRGSSQAQGQSRPTTTGQAPSNEQERSQGAKDQDHIQGNRVPNQNQRGKQEQNRRDEPRTQGQAPREGQAPRNEERQGQTPGNEQGQGEAPRTQGQGPAGGGASSVSLTTEQRTEIRQTVLNGRDVPRVNNVNFSVSVGTVVPRTVHLAAVPETLIRIHPEWRGYEYFVYNDEIIIVEANTLKIIAVVEV